MPPIFPRPVIITAWLIFSALFGANAPAYADYPPLVQQAFDNMAVRPDSPWSFLQTTTGKEEVIVERCEHDLETCSWTLVLRNGEAPTEEELERYRKDKAEEQERRGEKSRFDTLASPDSVVLLEQNDEQAIYRFDPLPEDDEDEKINKQLDGRLVVSKAGPYVLSFELKNNGTVRPAMFVKIHKMHITMEFAPVQEGGPYLPVKMQAIVEGKVGGLKKFEEDKRIRFTDYAL